MKRSFRWILLLVAVAIIAFVVGTVRSRQNKIAEDKKMYEEIAETSATVAGEQVADGLGGSTENPITDEAVVPAEEGVNTKLSRVKYSSANLQEAQAVNVVNDFYLAYNQKNQALVVALFDDSAMPSQISPAVWEESSPFPISFTFDQIEVRGDTTALVTVDHIFYDPNAKTKKTQRRLFELFPINDSYKIGKYFISTTDTPLAGFDN